MKKLKGWGLCLSGGGYRASLFHLGVTRRLHELGILQQITRVSSVSGGSIYAAFLADIVIDQNKNHLSFDDWDAEVSKPFRQFVRKDIRTGLFLRHVAWNWAKPGPRAKALERSFSKRLTDKKLVDLPNRKNLDFIFLATDMMRGVSWQFSRDEIGDYISGRSRTPESMPIAKAVAASACFPPLFGPIPITRERHAKPKTGDGLTASTKNTSMQTDYLTDGGVYDNTGMEPVWQRNKVVLVSDCGAPFDRKIGKNYISRIMRYASIGLNQVGAQRRRALVSRLDPEYRQFREFSSKEEASKDSENPCENRGQPGCKFETYRETDKPVGAYWRLGSKKSSFSKDASDSFIDEVSKLEADNNWYGYSDEIVRSCIASIRTDLDSFTSAESAILENHGYFLADLAIRRHAKDIVKTDKAFSMPHPEFADEKVVRQELKNSESRLMGWMRWFDRGYLVK